MRWWAPGFVCCGSTAASAKPYSQNESALPFNRCGNTSGNLISCRPAIRSQASTGRANRKPLRRPADRNELADPVTARRFDMPGHCLGRIGCRIGNVLADLLAVEPAAAVRVARLADE